jgi:hypothetical protein
MTVECRVRLQGGKEQGFVPAENKPFVVDLMAVGASDIGQNRIAMLNANGELWVFYPDTHPKRILADGSASCGDDDQ